ncbi:hypothetical protein H2200_002681 [Cladophialophora chaetospira]|uniref:Uncharacterized protein n=1 Tax=Cladophialophora chaetospira TaxID=386627 RepID=A0AA39CN94_9EURO|nr:hypothetical protein H2200_002681 [Cladophialophora chaetospira]
MSVVLTHTSGADYTPKYLFVSGAQHGTDKSRHVMKEFLRKRDSTRRQKQQAERSKSRVLPWLRREDMAQSTSQVAGSIADATVPLDSSSDWSSRPSSPQQSQWTAESTAGESPHTCSSLGSVFDFGRLLDNSRKVSHSSQNLVNNLHGGVISQLYETKESTDSISPASAMANHIMTQPASSQILLAISSLSHDIECGHQTPSLDTLGLIVDGIRLLQEQLQQPDAVSDDTILAVLSMWSYEVTLTTMFESENQTIPKTMTNNIQTHLCGLQRSITCRGGLRNLSPETLWLLAWCISTMPGYSQIDTRMMEPTTGNPRSPQTAVDSYYCLTRLFDTLSNIERHVSSPDSISGILEESAFSSLRRTLLRLNVMRRTLKQQKSPVSRLRKSTTLTVILLFIFGILLGGTNCAHQEARARRIELLQAQKRLVEHHLDEEGSFEKAWSVLMTQQEQPQLRLHPKTWSIVEMANVVKHLSVGTIDALAQLLMGYLLPETREDNIVRFRYERLLLQVHYELDGLADLS